MWKCLWVVGLLLGVCWAQCTSDADCPPAEELCHMAACVEGECETVSVIDDMPCDDGDACTIDGTCQGGVCMSTTVVCDDHNSCTRDLCHPTDGCLFEAVANDTPCDDGDACTTEDVCVFGACESGDAIDCTDDNPCTTGHCVAGECLQLGVVCEDTGDPLTVGVCDPARGGCDAVVKRTLLHEDSDLPWEVVVYLTAGGIALSMVPVVMCLLWSIYAWNKAGQSHVEATPPVEKSSGPAHRRVHRGARV